MNKEELKALVATMYKRKGKKVLPVNIPLQGGEPPGGGVNDEVITDNAFKPTVVPRGSRLTPERLAAMKIGTEFLSDAEKQLFIDILFEFEGAIAFDDSEMGLLNPAIEPPVHIRNTKLYDKWREPYRIIQKATNSTFYWLAELDGTPLSGTTAGNRLKKFYSREIADMLRGGNEMESQPGDRREETGNQETLTSDVAEEAEEDEDERE